ncbi:hypothetical protein OSB04_005919 [Centaurea solstitialis]|uniref:Integrase catalytic domain-containing protein n=1 Tax=Centaurea solstitialis TaxID=347529 RepID=A0AA38TGY7_9ASTR|nr:hypothetical protein OSB04_005919 [Centaurea solstitialis]
MAMVQKNSELVTMEDHKTPLPLIVASMHANKQMVHYLYIKTPKDLFDPTKGLDGVLLLNNLISADLFDVASLLLHQFPKLGVNADYHGDYALHKLASKRAAFASGNEFSFRKQLIYSCVRIHSPWDVQITTNKSLNDSDCEIDVYSSSDEEFNTNYSFRHQLDWILPRFFVSDIKHLHDVKLVNDEASKLLSAIFRKMREISKLQLERMEIDRALYIAIKHGIVEFLVELLQFYPEFIFRKDKRGRTIFSHAIILRQQSSHLHINLNVFQELLCKCNGNYNGTRLEQYYYVFFEVETLVPPKYKDQVNGKNRNPSTLFTEEHKDLAQEGEKWMKNTAKSRKTSRRRKKPAVDLEGKSTVLYDHQTGVMSFKFTAPIEPKKDVDKVHEDILASLEPVPEPADLMDTDVIDELGDLSCPECGSEDICEHSMNIDQIEIGLPDAPGSGNHICNHLQGFTRRKTLRKDRSNLRVGEGTPLIAEAVGSYSLSLPSGLVLELDNCYYIPNMIKNVLSFDLLVDQGFYYKYDYKMISVFKDNIFYFKATPVNGLYTVNLQDNSNEIYHISKRSKDIEDQTYLWHCRLGHINKKRIELLLKGGFLGTFDYKPFDNCESCLSGKMTKQPFNKENERATDLLEIIHTDVCGPFSHVARGGYWYFITFTEDFSRYGYVYLMRHKSESFERFKEFQNEVQNQLDRKIKFLRSDRGGEYLSDEFDNHLMECGIVSQLTPPYTPQMNGVSETRNRTLLDMVQTMMCHSTVPMSFWGHALETAAHILNRAPTKSVYVKRPTSEKLKPKSDKCFFVGYPRTTVGYYFYNPEEIKVFVTRNGKFLEEKFLSSGNTRKDVDLQVVDEENTTPIVEPEIQHENVEPRSETIEEVQTQDLRRSSRVRQEPDRYLGFLVSQDSGDLNEPTSYGEAVSGNESEQWQEAMKAEMQSMYDNQVWELTDLPQHCRAVRRKWVFKKKTDMDGNVHTFKARLVAKGFTQTHGIDYDETFSPVAMLKSIRILLAISAYFNYEIWQMDVKTAFLNEKLTEDVYMEQPEGFEDPKNPNKVCKLLKSVYGLKQASRSWNLHFDERIKEFGFTKSEFEPCVYTKFSGSIVTFLVLYVDDILLIGNDVPTLQSVKSWLSRCFQMKDLGEAAYLLGIKIYRNRSKRLIGLSQMLSKTQCPVSSQDQDRMKSVPYASAIGSIMYAMLCTRPDVAYSVAVKNILKYLRRTKDMFLVFGGSEDEISVTGYSDASFQTDRDDFRSQSGYVFTLNGGAISWKSSKQDTIADSTTEAEYIAASDAAKEAVWLRNFLSDLRVVASISRPIDIFCDNSGAVAQAKEPREHHKSRHVLRKYHLIREIIGRGDVRICKIPTKENVADPLTKPLARVKHEAHASSIGMQYLDASS